jgi:hypothetical protein
MRIPDHNERSAQILAQMAGWGFPPDIQQRIGVLAVVWSIFESNLETTLWALRGEKMDGIRPSTDKNPQVSDWIKRLGTSWSHLPTEAQEVLRVASLAAHDLMEYRHTLVHGWLLPSPTMPTSIRNPRWHGEKRKRPSHDAHVDGNLLDMAIDTAWILCRVVYAARVACSEPAKVENLTALKQEVYRARSEANELRHLSELMNDEKY